MAFEFIGVGGESYVFSADQLKAFGEQMRNGIPVPTAAREAYKTWVKAGRPAEGVDIDPDGDGRANQFAIVKPAAPAANGGGIKMAKPNNHVFVTNITGTNTQSVTIQPNEDLELADIQFTSNDATARIVSIKDGSRELLATQSGSSGVLVSAWRKDYYQGFMQGVSIPRTGSKLVVTVLHASSGTNVTDIILTGHQAASSCR